MIEIRVPVNITATPPKTRKPSIWQRIRERLGN
jgi:hypothetical protein